MTELKKWIMTALLTLLLLPAMAQQKADTTYTFRFVPREDMFYVLPVRSAEGYVLCSLEWE